MAENEAVSDLNALKSLTVLYVEDDDEIRNQLALFLKRRVGTLITGQNGEEGRRLFLEKRPDMVITDILMPVMDGLAMAKAIREEDAETPIIITTAYNEEKYFLRSIDLGVDRYVLKPTDPQTLIGAMVKCSRSLWRRREREASDRYGRFVLDIHPNLLVVVGHGEVEYLNATFLEFLGAPSLQAFMEQGPPLGDLILNRDGVPFSRLDGEASWIDTLLAQKEKMPIIYLKKPGGDEGEIRPFALTANAFPEQEKKIFSFSDITTLESQFKELEAQAFTDELTGVCNRASLMVRMNGELQRSARHDLPLSVLMFDIDHFKKVNDDHGHQTGDDILKGLADLVMSKMRASDTFARWGGEEFMILAPQNDIDGAANLAEKLRLLIEEKEFSGAGSVTCSFGVSQFAKGDTIRTLTERADQALYRAKEKGRNRVETG